MSPFLPFCFFHSGLVVKEILCVLQNSPNNASDLWKDSDSFANKELPIACVFHTDTPLCISE